VYESYYGLRTRPFLILPDPAFLYPSHRHKVALGLLEYGMTQSGGITVISGGIGTGKTTLIRWLVEHKCTGYTVGIVSHTKMTGGGGLLPRLLLAFKLEVKEQSETDLLAIFATFLSDLAEEGRRAVLIIDEAQNLSIEALEELRLLSNFNSDEALLQVVLAGQPGLRDLLRDPRLEQFAQRVAIDYHLEPLDRAEVRDYVRHRLRAAGARDPDLFDDSAYDVLYKYSSGVPRILNVLGETSLVYGYAEQKPRIAAATVQQVVDDRLRGGIFPLASREAAPTS
jgi:type II secretory pathway predicted ATPase ExeA